MSSFPTDRNNTESYLLAGIPSRQVGEYILQERLGSGSFATVFKAVKLKSQGSNIVLSEDESTVAAIKVINRQSDKMTKKVLENLDMEISILRTYRHPNIVCLKEVQKTDQHVFLILEFCSGGDVQQLIRSRKAGRLSEKLARRLMRDLSAGLDFLYQRHLIHRDIKPQNLLLTGPLPLDENDDGCKSESEEEVRRNIHFPSEKFHLKIADFGFARHLQSSSLADTLCGSPLYMAPEILQHKRYDAKADLWSAGAVLFEMITGFPPFTGENHLDLLHNIQHKPVRLPRDVRVSKECVNLLRLLLNRNPLHRAGFHEFFEATDAFVSLGCSGVAAHFSSSEDTESCDPAIALESRGSLTSRNSSLGPISEVEENHMSSGDSTVFDESDAPASTFNTRIKQSSDMDSTTSTYRDNVNETNSLCTPMALSKRISTTLTPITDTPTTARQYQTSLNRTMLSHPSFAPLEPSPPSIFSMNEPNKASHPPSPLSLDCSAKPEPSLSKKISELESLPTLSNTTTLAPLNQQSPSSTQSKGGIPHIAEENEFVIVEFANSQDSDSPSLKSEEKSNTTDDTYGKSSPPTHQGNSIRAFQRMMSMPSPPSPSLQPLSISVPRDIVPSRSSLQSSTNVTRSPSLTSKMFKGLLSTSPGTGGALMGWMSSSPSISSSRRNSVSFGQGTNPSSTLLETESDVEGRVHQRLSITSNMNNLTRHASAVGMMIKTLAAAEDVGRRAIHVAQLGDYRAWIGMKSIYISTNQQGAMDKSSPFAHFFMPLESMNPQEDMIPFQRQTFDLSLAIETSFSKAEDDDENDMPFAMVDTVLDQTNFSLPMIPARKDPILNTWSPKKKISNTITESSDVCFEEALSCYVKSMSMLKSSIHAVQRLLSELTSLEAANAIPRTFLSYSAAAFKPSGGMEVESAEHFRKRCEGSYHWLSSQFKCILDRADAANQELSKVDSSTSKSQRVRKVEEVIYHHALECGRGGAVKQLLGHFDAARSCYRSAGLLVETLLMEPSLVEEDKKVLEEYVIGFCDRILEVDTFIGSSRE